MSSCPGDSDFGSGGSSLAITPPRNILPKGG